MQPFDPRADAELAAALARAHLALAEADTDDAVLRAVAQIVAPHGPTVVRLYALHGEREPTEAELLSVWRDGQCPAEDPLIGRRFTLADHPVLARWQASPGHPLVASDLAAEPHPGPLARERGAQALVVLPLHSADPDAWLGLLVFTWPIVHIPGARERLVYDLLARTLAAFLAGRRALREHQRALDEANALYVATSGLTEATGIDEILAALAEPAQAAGATWAALWACERDDEGAAQRLVLAAPTGAGPGESRPALALSGLFVRPNQPWLFSHVDTDTPIGAGARASGVASALLLPLAWRGRWIGLVELGWPAARLLPPELQRLYAALARHAAVVLDNRLLLIGAERALHEARRERHLLGAVVEALPLAVVVTDAATGAPVLHNASTDLLLGVDPDPQSAADRTFAPEGESPLAYEHWPIARALAAGQPVRQDVEWVHPDGRRLALDVVAAPVRDGAGQLVSGVTVMQDVTDRRNSEREALALRDELIRAQEDLLAERSTPLIPLTDDIIAFPLVGTIDEERGRKILESAAELGGRTGVRAAIIDFTGVPGLDNAAAQLVLEAARALRLRGVDPVFTGIRPEVAATLVEIGVDLREVAICRTLEDAIARARQRMGG